jgi:MbtH protein
MAYIPQEQMYFVVKNDEEQYSIWPEFKELPGGWHVVGERGTKNDCLSRIEGLWTDMRPLTVRKHLEATAETRKRDRE